LVFYFFEKKKMSCNALRKFATKPHGRQFWQKKTTQPDKMSSRAAPFVGSFFSKKATSSSWHHRWPKKSTCLVGTQRIFDLKKKILCGVTLRHTVRLMHQYDPCFFLFKKHNFLKIKDKPRRLHPIHPLFSMILSIQNVLKRYQNHTAVDHVSFDVPKGCVFGLLGPNGAGKTSLIRMITTITAPDSGQIMFDGQRLNDRTPERIGYMPEERGLYKKMKVGEQLIYLARLKGLSAPDARREVDHWFKKFGIKDWHHKKVEDLSKGMQQKAQFIATVIHRPPLLILDEPFSGLDPINSNLIKDEIAELHRAGTSIIFSTHRMEQVEEMCDHIVLINRGQNVLCGEVGSIKNQYKKNLFEVKTDGDLPADLADHFAVVAQTLRSVTVQIETESRSNALLSWLLQRGVPIRSFREILPSFNEIFIRTVEGEA
jgi:ABC-2 type transport system ATP-binding protein